MDEKNHENIIRKKNGIEKIPANSTGNLEQLIVSVPI